MSTHRVESRAPLIDASTAGHHSPDDRDPGAAVRIGLDVATGSSSRRASPT